VVSKELSALVRERAQYRCEYCRIPEGFAELEFQIDHVVARQHIADNSYENLALSCCRCNWHKGTNLAGIDPETGQRSWLFDPRNQRWPDHFDVRNAFIAGLSPVGRATTELLRMNAPGRVALRRELIAEGKY